MGLWLSYISNLRILAHMPVMRFPDPVPQRDVLRAVAADGDQQQQQQQEAQEDSPKEQNAQLVAALSEDPLQCLGSVTECSVRTSCLACRCAVGGPCIDNGQAQRLIQGQGSLVLLVYCTSPSCIILCSV